jgi:hypothetical protein
VKRRHIGRNEKSRRRHLLGFYRGWQLTYDAAETRVFLFTMVRRLRRVADRRDEKFQWPRQLAHTYARRREQPHCHEEYQESCQAAQSGIPLYFVFLP